MNIVIFCSNAVDGGTARIFYELVISLREMLREGNRIIACTDWGNPVKIYKKIDGLVRLPIYPEEEICRGMYGGSREKRALNMIKRTLKYRPAKKHNIAVMEHFLTRTAADAVLIHNGGYVGDSLCNQMLTAAYRSRPSMPVRIFVLHNDMEKGIFAKLRFFPYDKKISKEATSIVTVSQYTKNRMEKSSFISQEIQVVPNGISCSGAGTGQRTVQAAPGKFNVLMIGNFMPNKGQYHFIKAAAMLAARNQGFHFTMIGNVYDGGYFRKCKELIRKRGMQGYISVYHGVNNASEYIGQFDVLAVPSLYDESFGLISVEAMAAGRPVVAFACGGIPEVVRDGVDGFTVPVGDARAMARKIQWLAKNPEKAEAMGAKGRQKYREHFSVEPMAARYLELLGAGQGDADGI